jgi:rubrerythrin
MFKYQEAEKFSFCFDNKFCNNVQIPCLPLKGPKSFDQILCLIKKAIEDEANAADFYRHLLKDAPNKLHCEFIQHAYDDEVCHLQILTRLYLYYTDCDPKYCITPVCYPCYRDGLLKALIDEIKAVEFYRDIQLSTMDQVIRDTFFMIMVDEQEHATMFSTLYSNIPCK